MYYFCCNKERRDATIESDLNGIDFVEVQDDPALPNNQRQRTLSLYFVKPPGALALTTDNFIIEGGERITDINVLGVGPGADSHVLELEADKAGDFSIYTLCLVSGVSDHSPPAGVDPAMAFVDFSFKVECPSDFDCKPQRVCPETVKARPPINYLTKDYASFRRLMLDRMALTAPEWRRRNAADLGMTLVEMLAYVGDHLSYQQDAVQTEGYIDLARNRVSVKRHARIVDYFMHDGCNSRTWVQVVTNADTVLDYEFMVGGQLLTTLFLTAIEKTQAVIEPDSRSYRNALKHGPVIFEPIRLIEPKTSAGEVDVLKALQLFADHESMDFYTWSDAGCCLPRGAVRASLRGHFANLQKHDVLVFEEVKGPLTGLADDADIAHRHAVKLVDVELAVDPVTTEQITNIQWQDEDALPFALCISSLTDESHGSVVVNNVSVARGNIVLCDHGRTVSEELTPEVPAPILFYRDKVAQDRCDRPAPEALPVRYRPQLSKRPLTHAAPYQYNAVSARAAMDWGIEHCRPAVRLQGKLGPDTSQWTPVRDLLNSDSLENHFVTEIDNAGQVQLRFGNDLHGRLPQSGMEFSARYRIGNGVEGNIGADAIRHIVTLNNSVTSVRNLLPASGGTRMESMASVRSKAPYAYRRQERAVTEADYAEVTERQSGIQKAQATFRWTGSWHTVFLTIDRETGLPVNDEFREAVRQGVERFRMAGHDLNVDAPRFVPLEISMFVCVKPDYFRSEVKRALLDVFSSRDLPDGSRGLFHPDRFTFGQSVYLSPLYQAAQSVPGVDSVRITTFQRLHQDDNTALNDGKLFIDRLEIAQLQNDANFREKGNFSIEMGGGK